MRKSEKRKLGALKQSENLATSRESGLRAQETENVRRREEEQRALIARAARSAKKGDVPDDSPASKISQEKKARVAKRMDDKAKASLLFADECIDA